SNLHIRADTRSRSIQATIARDSALPMGIHHIERHLNRVELESVAVRNFEHVKMHARIFVPGKPDVSNLARIACLYQSGVCSFIIKDAMRIFVTEDLMMLDEIDRVHLQTLKRFIKLS